MITRRLARPLGASSPSNWVCPSCRTQPSSLLRRRQPQAQQQKRTLLNVPPLNYHTTFTRDGIPGLMSERGYQLAWTDYQTLTVQKLNELIAGEPFENDSPKTLLLRFARDPMNASLFNHASMAHNNQFFFEGLSPSPQKLEKCPNLQDSLEATFGSVDTLRTTMLDTASAMFGPGFVWLVWIRAPADDALSKGHFRVLTTYIAGTPYPEAGYRQQGLDMASNNASSYADYAASQQRPNNTVGAIGKFSEHGKKEAKYPPGGTEVIPLLCVNTWEHVYLYDYGVGGKRRYLADWWDCIDWHKVEQNTPLEARNVQWQSSPYR